MSILLSFTIIELIPLAIDYSQQGLIFVVFGILIPLTFHRSGHDHIDSQNPSFSTKLLMLGATIHSFVDGLIISTGLFIDQPFKIVLIGSMLLHKLTEVTLFSLILCTLLTSSLNLIRYLVYLSFASISGMLMIFFIEKIEGFKVILGVGVSISAGIFLYISLMGLSKVVECSKLKHINLYPFIGCSVYFCLHMFLH